MFFQDTQHSHVIKHRQQNKQQTAGIQTLNMIKKNSSIKFAISCVILKKKVIHLSIVHSCTEYSPEGLQYRVTSVICMV